MIFNRDMCHLLLCSTKANDKYFWPFLFPTFFSSGDQINRVTTFSMSYLWSCSQRKVHYEIRSLVLYIPTEKCGLLNISERTCIRVSSTDTSGKNIFLSPPSCNLIIFNHILLRESIDVYYIPKHTFF